MPTTVTDSAFCKNAVSKCKASVILVSEV
jgi:hypothetical protein